MNTQIGNSSICIYSSKPSTLPDIPRYTALLQKQSEAHTGEMPRFCGLMFLRVMFYTFNYTVKDAEQMS